MAKRGALIETWLSEVLWLHTDAETPESELLTWLSDVLWFAVEVETPESELETWLSDVL